MRTEPFTLILSVEGGLNYQGVRIQARYLTNTQRMLGEPPRYRGPIRPDCGAALFEHVFDDRAVMLRMIECGVKFTRLYLHDCRQCGQHYLGQPTTEFCSAKCRLDYRRPGNTALKQKRRQSDREYRLRYDVIAFCEHCDGHVRDAQRKSKRFCSDKCRKAAKRKAQAKELSHA